MVYVGEILLLRISVTSRDIHFIMKYYGYPSCHGILRISVILRNLSEMNHFFVRHSLNAQYYVSLYVVTA